MKVLLVDDEKQILRGVSRMLESEMEDWEIETAESGPEALDLLNSDDFNVIISDMRMPGMDGAQLLEQVAARFPKMLRVVLSGQADRQTVMRAVQPMHQYLSKPCDAHVLVEIISRAEIFQETISSKEVLDAIGKANGLPSVPDVVTEINAELDSDNCTSQSIAKIISRDPIVSARVLQLANSTIFGLRQPVVDLKHGVGVIGNEMVRSLVLSHALFSEGQHDSILSTAQLFDHCFQTAMVARELAPIAGLNRNQMNSVFTGGLLHDIGKIILVNAFPERYDNILGAAKTTIQPIWQLEMEEFGATHPGIGAYLLEMWGIPVEIIGIVGSHHSAELCAKGDLDIQIVYAANWIVNGGDENEIQKFVDSTETPELVDAFRERLLNWKTQYNEKLVNKDSSDA